MGAGGVVGGASVGLAVVGTGLGAVVGALVEVVPLVGAGALVAAGRLAAAGEDEADGGADRLAPAVGGTRPWLGAGSADGDGVAAGAPVVAALEVGAAVLANTAAIRRIPAAYKRAPSGGSEVICFSTPPRVFSTAGVLIEPGSTTMT